MLRLKSGGVKSTAAALVPSRRMDARKVVLFRMGSGIHTPSKVITSVQPALLPLKPQTANAAGFGRASAGKGEAGCVQGILSEALRHFGKPPSQHRLNDTGRAAATTRGRLIVSLHWGQNRRGVLSAMAIGGRHVAVGNVGRDRTLFRRN